LREVKQQTGISPLTDEHIGMYRHEISKQELAFMEGIAKSSLREFGYEVEPIHFAPQSRLIYAFWHWPSNLIRFGTWLGVEFFQQNFPQRFGRKPASNMIIKDATV
jgi:hypothetical protein